MKKSYYLLLIVILCFAGKIAAQSQEKLPCYTDELYRKHIATHPEILKLREDIEKQIKQGLKTINYNRVTKRTTTDESGVDSFWYDIPIVVHIIHDYNANEEYLTDDDIFNDLVDWNIVYAKENYDTSNVITPYAGNIPNSNVRYIGNVHIRLHLATRDPNGNPTKGITRHRNYLTYTAGDISKFDDWPNTSYVNIWVVNNITVDNGEAAAYAYFPDEATSFPYYDGVICDFDYVANAYTSGPAVSKTINHELGHVFNLYHPWGPTNQPGVACGDDDVDDTPPTYGHTEPGCRFDLASSNLSSTYDSNCASNYYKLYTSAEGTDSLVNYPDTTNAQNIMDYTYCSRMFTAGQVARMHTALNSNVSDRNNLWDTTNLMFTGVWDASFNPVPMPDLKPIPEFAISKTPNGSPTSYANRLNYFTFPNNSVTFYNESWNDTVTNVAWTFSNGASTPTSNSLTTVTNSFTTPGWVSLTMAVTGNNTGTDTVTWPRALFVTNTTGTPGASIFQEFSGADTVNWPTFNYYNNEFYWQIANTGMYDNYSLEYVGYDSRIIIDPSTGTYSYPVTGMPNGDVDDFFTIPVDLSSYTVGNASLNFAYSGASRSSISTDITDTLEIDYSANKGASWNYLTILSKGTLDNKGSVNTAYTPSSPSDWSQQSIDLPAAALTNYTVFRFQYRPNIGVDGYSSGNNFYMDRIHFSSFPSSVGNVNLNNTDIVVVPNPTSGNAYVIMKGIDNALATITVTDITGRVVYTASQQVTGNTAQIEIPQHAIPVAGMYIVQAVTGANAYTQKFVVE